MSNTKCCVPGCQNSQGSSVTLHKFPNPAKNPNLFKTWVSAIGGDILEIENDHIFKYRCVCHQHFIEKYWCRNNRISNIAIPTLNMPESSASVPLQINTEIAVEESQMKENIGPLTLPEYISDTRRPLTLVTNLTEPSTSKGPLSLPEYFAGKRKPLTIIKNSIESLTLEVTSGPVTLPEHIADKIPLRLIENSTEPSTAKDKGILASECRDTADILLFFDKLFDSVNGSFTKKKKHGKPLLGPATPNSIHHQVWSDLKKDLKQMKFVNTTTGKAEHVPTLNNWVWTLEGIEFLLKNLKEKYGVTSVWLRHLNQDPIENFFGAIRSHGCRNVNPTPERFESAFTTLLVNSLSNVHAPGANCEEDHCHILNELIITKESKALPTCEIDKIPEIQITPLEEKNDVREIGGLQYVSGYFIRNTKKHIFKGCTQCQNDLIARDEPEYIRYREYAGKQWLCSPSDSLLLCVSNLQDINYTIIKTSLEKKNLKELIKTLVFTIIEFDFIKCEKHKDEIIDYLINISCRFFIHNYCKEINKILNNKRECDNAEDKFKTKAKKYFYKCYKRKK